MDIWTSKCCVSSHKGFSDRMADVKGDVPTSVAVLDWVKLLQGQHVVGLTDQSGSRMLQFVKLYRTRDPTGLGNRYFWIPIRIWSKLCVILA